MWGEVTCKVKTSPPEGDLGAILRSGTPRKKAGEGARRTAKIESTANYGGPSSPGEITFEPTRKSVTLDIPGLAKSGSGFTFEVALPVFDSSNKPWKFTKTRRTGNIS